MVETPKRYLVQKNLFELFAVTGSGDTKISGVSSGGTIVCTRATW